MAAWLVAVSLSGCASYELRGLVIEGSEADLEVVSADDPRLENLGLTETTISVYLDPQRLSPKQLARGRTDNQGDFALPITESGAGFLILDVEVLVERSKFQTLRRELQLPGGGKRLLITLPPGKGGDTRQENVLERTMREAGPYLEE